MNLPKPIRRKPRQSRSGKMQRRPMRRHLPSLGTPTPARIHGLLVGLSASILFSSVLAQYALDWSTLGGGGPRILITHQFNRP